MKSLTILALTIGLATPALAQIPVNQCGQVLSAPGHYVLTANLCNAFGVGGSGTGLTISASRVHLDTAGHAVSAFLTGIVINDGLSHLRIDGGGLIAGGDGVVIGGDQDVTLNNVTLLADASIGTGKALILRGANRVSLTNTTLSSAGCLGGPVISGTVENGLFASNTINGGGCEIAGGIGLDGADNTIRNNTISLPGDFAGFAINVGSDTLIEKNTIQLLASPTSRATDKIGIELTGDGSHVKSNTITGNTPNALYGIFAAQGAIGNTITKNSVSGNEFDLFESNGPPCVNTWKKNTFQTSGGAVACIN